MSPAMWSTLVEKLKGVSATWSVYTALGSFVLYFLGYLVLRFQLATWGVITDLSVLDERYFFAGARFVVYLVTSTVNALLLAFPLFLGWRLLNRSLRFQAWRKGANPATVGVVVAVLFIQFVERQCFQAMNGVLVQPRLYVDGWLRAILLDEFSDGLFFAGLMLGVAITGWLLVQAKLSPVRKPAAEALLVFLVAVEFLLLPVNFGILISTKVLCKVTQFAPAEAWLVSEGKDKTTFLLMDKQGKLVSVPNSEVKKLEITGMTQIYQRLFPNTGR